MPDMTGHRLHLALLISLFAVASSPVARAAEPALAARQWQIDGVARQALVYAPESAVKTDAPLVFAFHGHGGSMRNAAATFNVHKLWPEAIVVYMQGLPTPGVLTDPEGKKNGWQMATGDQGDRDLKFFDEVLATIKKEYKVDAKRIFATGHSNGGAFTYLLWAARGDTFAAFAPSGAATRQFRDLKPKPALHVAGEKDELVNFALQQRMINIVRRTNGCDAEGKEWAKSGTVTGTIYPSKTETPLVTLIYPGPHKFPAEVPEMIVKFFKEQKPVER